MTMLKNIATAALAVIAAVSSTRAGELKLWYEKPAAKWEEALPIGCGSLGAMVFGGAGQERIQFNEDTLWTGKPHDYVREGAGDHLDEIRQMVFAGADEKQIAAVVKQTFLSDPVRQKMYQPFGDILFSFAGHNTDPTNYRRELDLETAIATTTYTIGDVTYTREAFASYPARAIVVHVAADKPRKISFDVLLKSPHRTATTRPVSDDTIAMSGQVLDPTAKDEPGMKFESRLRAVTVGAKVKPVQEQVLEVRSADEATFVLVAATSYVNFQDISADPAKRCEDYLAKIAGKSYEELKREHIADHQALFHKVKLELGHSDAEKLPTDQRLKAIRAAANPTGSTAKDAPVPSELPKTGITADSQFAALFFQFGRYMLIVSSRPHTQPANLQGVWNELMNPPWESKYTTNINLQMNYWPAEVANLSPCAEPLFDMVDDLRISGAVTAKKQYHARGWVLHHNTDHWRGTAPINNIDGVWPTGGAWLCYHLWEHYLFTGDKDFLAKRAYPAMKEASLFFVDSLVKDPKTGYLVTCPSFSPEQGGLCAGPAMDMQIIRALFDSTAEAAKILSGIDSNFVRQLADMRAKLAPDKIDQYGELQEWQEEVDQRKNNHRHMSPLFGLFPAAQWTPTRDAKIFDAAKVLLKSRGDGSTGWSYAWRIPLWARVGDGQAAYRQLALQIGKKTLPNCFDLCGPYQADGNFGATAGIAEMLLQSHDGTIDLLPAVPKEWPSGSVTGLCARGGFEIDMTWSDGKLTRAAMRSRLGNTAKIRYADKSIELKTEPGKSYDLDFK